MDPGPTVDVLAGQAESTTLARIETYSKACADCGGISPPK